MKLIYLALLVVLIVVISSMAEETNKNVDQKEIKQYTESAEKIAEHQENLV